MTIKFKLEIELGNDAMSSSNDIAESLNKVGLIIASDIEFDGDDPKGLIDESGKILDVNGNSVGRWVFVED